jgi:hypothetical protein
MALRYFNPRPGSAPAASGAANPVTHALDVFVLEGAHGQATEWVVGFDDLGQLAAQPGADVAAGAGPRAQLAYHEVAGGARRVLALPELHLFALQLVEQAPQSPGFDDPVHLYGTLLGPLTPGGLIAAGAVEGQLTVTRGDLLEAAARGARHAFRHGGGAGGPAGVAGARSFHLLLPGDRGEEIERGAGVVLAYPIMAADLHAAVPGNEFFFNQILYDVITALWADVQTEAPPPRRRPEDVPVPDRTAAVQRLLREGFVVEGNQVVRRRKGLLGSVLGALIEDRRPLPAEGHCDQYVQLADEALSVVLSWPSPRARSLRACVRSDLGQASTIMAAWPSLSASSTPFWPPPPPPPPPPRRPAGPPAWMADFIAARVPAGAPPPIVTGARSRLHDDPTLTGHASAQPPAWMSDFARADTTAAEAPPGESADRAAKPEDPATAAKPDWLKDFDP